MKFFFFVVLIVGSVLLLSACRTDGTTPGAVPHYKQGITGVEVSILPQMPPREIYEGSQLRISLQVSNKGAYDVGSGLVSILGLSEAWTPLYFSEVPLQSLKGRSIEAPEGDFFIAEFNGKGVVLPPGSDVYKAKFWATVRYEYSTVMQTDVCVNSELLVGLKKSSGSCTVRNSMSLSGQGAPVAVTRVEEVVIPSGDTTLVQFTLTIENKGKGEVVSDILVDDVKLANRRLICDVRVLKPEDLKKKTNKVVCRVNEALSSAYTTTLSAVLYYTYQTRETGIFDVKRIAR